MDYKITILLWVTLGVNADRWYSATVENNSTKSHIGPPSTTYSSIYEQNEVKYMPLQFIGHENITTDEWMGRSKFDFLKKFIPTMPPPQIFIYNPQKRNSSHTNKVHHEQLHLTETDKRVTNVTTRRQTQPIKINRTITNVNIIKNTKPKSKTRKKPKGKLVRRCPAVKPRQKKELALNQTAQRRFLEVFEVVEFDHEACTSSSGLDGTCLPEFECQNSGGYPMGSCADGYGICCVTQFSCEERSAAMSGWFVSPGFPSPSTERLSCTFTLDKASPDIRQIRLDFNNFELLAPTYGTCEHDQFVVMGQNGNNVIPILCGVNSGQHVYIEVGDVEGPITFSILTVSSDRRLFSIKINQLFAGDIRAAPTGCLQYFRSPLGYLESFNFRDKSDIGITRIQSYLNNLNYAMCIERAPDACSVTYTNTGGMQIVNYDTDGLPVIPPEQAGVEIFNCPTDWLLIAATRLCGDRLNDGSVLQDFALDAPVTDTGAGPIVIWFRSDGGYVGKGFKLQYQQNNC